MARIVIFTILTLIIGIVAFIEKFRLAFHAYITDPFDALPWAIHAICLIIILIWTAAFFRMRDFIPRLNEKDVNNPHILAHSIKFILSEYRLSFKEHIPFPSIIIVESEDALYIDPDWRFRYDFLEGAYDTSRNIIYLLEPRIDLLVHELAHYVQYFYTHAIGHPQSNVPFEFTDERELEAWDMTRSFMRRFHPISYWGLMSAYSLYGLWGSQNHRFNPFFIS